MKTLSKLLIVLGLTFSISSPSFAWGDREQGIVTGIAGTLLWQHLAQPKGYASVPTAYPATLSVPYYPGTVYRDYTYRPMYKAVDVFIPECNCYRTVMVQIN